MMPSASLPWLVVKEKLETVAPPNGINDGLEVISEYECE
jgi:hypothetical protein